MTKDIEREETKSLKKAIKDLYEECDLLSEEEKDEFDNLFSRALRLGGMRERLKLEGCVVVPEWISIEDQLPKDGQKCLVVFEVIHSADDANRFMEIDTFNDGEFDSIIEYEEQASTVALPAGSNISKLRAVCWVPTELSNKPLTFDQFYVEAARGGNENI